MVVQLEAAGTHGDTGEAGIDRVAEVARHERGSAAAGATLEPGGYAIELHHARAGDASAGHQVVFLRPSPGNEAAVAAAEAPGAVRLTATTNCNGCDVSFSNRGIYK